MVMEFLTGSAIAAIAKETLAPIVTETLQEGGKNLIDFVGQDLNEKTRQLIFNVSERYGQNYAERHGILKVLGMRESVSLDSVYTNVRLLDEYGIRRFESIENLEKAFRDGNKRRFQSDKCEKQVGVEVANKEQYLMVLGAPGSGKSTFLRKMGLEALKGKKGGLKKHHCIPVFLELKRFTESDLDIKQLIADEFATCGSPKAESFTEKALNKGNLLILFDGLDEVPSAVVNDIIDKIQDFVDRYHKNRFIASCRTAAYRSRFRRFKDLEMADFDDEQIEKFINNWFNSEKDRQEKTAEYCWKLLQDKKHKGSKELAQTPLLLTFLCLVYAKSQDFPNNRSVLYRKSLRILLEEWAAEKNINQDKIYEGLSVELEEMLLAEIAYTNFIEDRLFFEQRSLTDKIKTFLTSNLNAPKHLDGESILNAIAVQQGILIERTEEIYSFSHLTLQEYLTAQYITDDNKIAEVVEKHLFDPAWKEIFLLVAGLMKGSKGADRLLVKIQEEIEKLLEKPINKERLIPILQWAEQETKDSGGTLSLVAKRAIANANALANANVFKKLINAVEEMKGLQPVFTHLNIPTFLGQLKALQEQIPGKEASQEVRRAFAQKILDTNLVAFNLKFELINWTEEEAKEIDNYHYATHILIECKEAAARVSPATWANIEERMFRVPAHLL
ncbi:NACHT domain-containing protein [Spirulina sp. 06S082]|uniref:NACHT domain-containing protein n=1 Tax=Spirulina sp. 06S082 TaxID=3110248 RepID=UPI002B1EA75A|nr:NACHT domain-containing protein [Spirulina sp. 06S082]MEA5470879.1 NACHT domain-containing protein [Spirulina sp. 06S082]